MQSESGGGKCGQRIILIQPRQDFPNTRQMLRRDAANIPPKPQSLERPAPEPFDRCYSLL